MEAGETVTLRVHGRVQGVGFRAWSVREATRLGLHGWVRNRTDGTVEMLLSGERAQIAALALLCHRGPRMARVRSVETGPGPDTPVARGFCEKPDA